MSSESSSLMSGIEEDPRKKKSTTTTGNLQEEQSSIPNESSSLGVVGVLPVRAIPGGEEDQPHYLSSAPPSPQVIVYKKRFFVLLMFLVLSMSNQMQSLQFATVVQQTISVMNGSCSEIGVNILFIIYSAVYIVFAFPTCVVFKRYGLRKGLVAGSALNLSGAVIKGLAVAFVPNYYFLTFGQTLAAMGQMAVVSLPPMVSTTWFPISERSTATAAGAILGLLGIALGYAIPPQIVHESAGGDALRQQYNILSLFSGGLALIPFLGTLFGVPEGPPSPPSVSSPEGRGEEINDDAGSVANVWKLTKDLIKKNKNFAVFCAAFGFQGGITTALSAVLAQILNKPYGVKPKIIGITVFFLLPLAVFFSAIASRYVDLKRVYTRVIVFVDTWFIFFGVVFLFGITAVPAFFPPNQLAAQTDALPWILLVPNIVGSACAMAFLPVAMELAVELTYPMNEVIPNTLCQLSISIVGLIGTVGYTLIIGDSPTREKSVIIYSITLLIIILNTLLIGFGVKEDLRRLASEKKAR